VPIYGLICELGKILQEGGMATPRILSVQKAFALLHSFRSPEEWVTNAELSRRTGLSEPCAHRLMKTMEEIGAVVRDKRGCYRPGMVLATLSKDVAIGSLIRATSEDALAALAARLKGVAHVGVLEGGMVTYAAKFGEPVDVPIPSRVGAQQEAYCSALGKILLASLTPQQLEDFLHDGDFIALTPQTITTVESLRSEIAAVRQRGYAVDDREAYQTICCVGVPIRDPNGNITAAISFADSSRNLCPAWQEEVAGQLIATAETISRKIFPVYEKTAH
jgi:DNA-binding IclR family transcriptional regulator